MSITNVTYYKRLLIDLFDLIIYLLVHSVPLYRDCTSPSTVNSVFVALFPNNSFDPFAGASTDKIGDKVRITDDRCPRRVMRTRSRGNRKTVGTNHELLSRPRRQWYRAHAF